MLLLSPFVSPDITLLSFSLESLPPQQGHVNIHLAHGTATTLSTAIRLY